MSTIRKQYHDIGARLHMGIFTIGAIRDGLAALRCADDNKTLQQDLAHNCTAIEESLMELEREICKVKNLTYRLAGPDTSVEELSETIQKENAGLKLLIVEDDDVICGIFTETYQRKGFRVEKALSKEEAFEKLKEFCPDIVIIDLYLQNGKEGVEVLRHVKTCCPNTKTIVVTCEDQEAELKPLRDLEPDELMLKPVRAQSLEAKINGMVKAIKG